MRLGWMGALSLVGSACLGTAQEHDIRGAWRADTYVLKDGTSHHVDGLMIFSESEWAVVYFVKDDDGEPQRGAGEGGPYTLDGDELVLTRDYLVIAGNEIGGLREIPLRFDAPGVTEPVVETCRLEYVRSDLPPILTLHGDSDSIVPYAHAVRLHDALEAAGAPNQLHTITGGDHGSFTLDENLEAMRVIREFLTQHGIVEDAAGATSNE